MVKGISYNFNKATYNYSCILCFAVLEHKNKIFKLVRTEEGHGLNENTLLSRENDLSSDRNIKKKKKKKKSGERSINFFE